MGVLLLLVQCVAMFAASLLVGSLPLMFKSAASGKRLKAISVFGMGILVGAALTIIIPEGVSTLYEAIPFDAQESAVNTTGFSLLAGFALMLCVESLTPHPPHDGETVGSDEESASLSSPEGRDSNDTSRPTPNHLHSSSPIMPKRLHVRDPPQVDNLTHSHAGRRALNATLGLVIHGTADGIALGASSLSDRSSLGFIVFLAVLVHKGPTALGLTTTLLSLSLTPPMIRKCLIIFSFAAPIGALITYGLVLLFGNTRSSHSSDSIDRVGWWTGIALLFSGGSFLYVATVIQPLSEPSDHHDHKAQAGGGGGDSPTLGKYTRTALLISGMLLPVLLSTVVGGEEH